MAVNAMALPILPGKLEAWHQYNSQINGPRRSEFEDMMKRHSFTRWLVWRQQTPQGDLLILFQETKGQEISLESIRASPILTLDGKMVGVTAGSTSEPVGGGFIGPGAAPPSNSEIYQSLEELRIVRSIHEPIELVLEQVAEWTK